MSRARLARLAPLGAAAALGAILSLSQAPLSAWPLLFLGLPAVFLLQLRASPRRAALIGWLFGVGYFLPGLLWIGEAFLVDAETFGWMRPFAVTLLPMGLALFWALAFAAAAAATRRLAGAPSDAAAPPERPMIAAAALAASWSLAEYARGTVLTGFPWGMFGFAWIDTPTAQIAAHVGPYGLTAVTITAALALGAAAATAGAARRASAALGVGLPLLALAIGAARLAPAATATDAPVIRLVQPNVPQEEKWAPVFVARNYQRLISLSALAPEPGAEAPSLVVWPETATRPEHVYDADLRVRMAAGALALAPEQRLVMGTQRFDRWFEPDATARQGWFNALFAIGPDGRIEAIYDKHHLVPFGEYLPAQGLLESLGMRQLAGRMGGFRAGRGPRTIALHGGLRALPLICYEAIFPWAARASDARPDLLLQITNDAWFGDSGGPRQHLAQARMRAIEQGLPLLRAANTGVSAAIDPYGRITDRLDLGRTGAIDVQPTTPLPPTLYAQAGDVTYLPIVVAQLLLITFIFKYSRVRNR
ncbi:MAG: apolipoprotein N-acyltransferase [Pseudomonadota bacterium]